MKKLKKKQKWAVLGGFSILLIYGIFVMFTPWYSIPYDQETISKLQYSGENVLVITPWITESAYGMNGFYDYYSGYCGEECLTVPMQGGRPDRWGSYNLYTVKLFHALGYPIIDDYTVSANLSKNNTILDQYDTIILLHSEYVTKEFYTAITNHKKVIYLAPNALYAEVRIDYHLKESGGSTITLIRGHGYPTPNINNSFGWKHDNTPEEYDTDCYIWKFREISNGYQLNCAQEIYSQRNPSIMLKVKELINQ